MPFRSLTPRTLLILLLCLGVVAGWLVYQRLILPAGPFLYDEAAHALRGRLVAWDVQQGDWLGLLFDTYRQVYWPPIHSWLTGAMFLLFGASEVNARLLSMILWISLALTLFFIARRLNGPAGAPAGVIAALLALTSPPLIDSAAKCMLEIPGMLALSLTLLAYLRTVDEDTPTANLLLAAALLATFFTKTNYGILMLMTVALMRLLEARFQPRRLMRRGNLWLALPMLIVFAVWFAYPAKLVLTWQTMVHRPIGRMEPFTLEGLLFYPRALVRLSGSALLFAVYMAALAAALRFWRNPKVRLAATVVLLQFLLAEFHHTKDARHILPMLPPLFLLAGHYCLAWWEHARSAPRRTAVWAPRLVTALMLVLTLTLPRGMEAGGAAPGSSEMMQYVTALAQQPGDSLIVSSNEHNPPLSLLLDWTLIQAGQLLPPQAGSMALPREERKLAGFSRRLPEWLAGRLTPVFFRAEQPGKLRTIIIGLPPEFDAPGFARFFPSTLKRGNFTRVITITPLLADPMFPLPGQKHPQLDSHSSRKFPTAATRVDLYQVTGGPAFSSSVSMAAPNELAGNRRIPFWPLRR